MPDISHVFGQDLTLTPSGDIALIDGSGLTTQRVYRRLMTVPLGYLWEPTYGAGLGAFVGQPVSPRRITAVVRSQMRLESTVARTPTPTVTVSTATGGLVNLAVTYADATAPGQPVTVYLPV